MHVGDRRPGAHRALLRRAARVAGRADAGRWCSRAGGAANRRPAATLTLSAVSRTNASSRLSCSWRMPVIRPPCPATTAETARRWSPAASRTPQRRPRRRRARPTGRTAARATPHQRRRQARPHPAPAIGSGSRRAPMARHAVLGHQPAAVQDADPVGRPLDLAQDVRRDQDRDAALVLLGQDLARPGGCRADRAPRPARPAPAAPARAAAPAPARASAASRVRSRAPAAAGTRHSSSRSSSSCGATLGPLHAVEPPEEQQVLPGAQVVVQVLLLADDPDAASCRERVGRPGAAEQLDDAGRRPLDAEQHQHRRRLAGAVRTEEAVDLALSDRSGSGRGRHRCVPYRLRQARSRAGRPPGAGGELTAGTASPSRRR